MIIFSIKKKWLHRLMCLYVLLITFHVHAVENAQLNIKPTRCIALHEGQVCYQKINISWKTDSADHYCLHLQDNKVPLTCWDNLSSAKWSYEFEGNTTQKFMLIRKQDSKQVAEVSIEVAWVYDSSSRRESHWRIF